MTLDAILELVRQVARVHPEPADLDDHQWPDTVDGLVTARDTIGTVLAAAGHLRSVVDGLLTARLDGHRGYRTATSLLEVAAAAKWRPQDEAALVEWVVTEGDPRDFAEVVNVSSGVRVTGLRAVAERRGLDPGLVVDTFLTREEVGERRLSERPLSRAPKFVQDADVGLIERNRR